MANHDNELTAAFIGDAAAGKTCLAALVYHSARSLATSGAIRLDPALTGFAFLDEVLVPLNSGGFPDANVKGKIGTLAMGLEYPRVMRSKTIQLQLADLAGADIEDVANRVLGNAKNPSQQYIGGLASLPALKEMFEANIVLAAIDSGVCWNDFQSPTAAGRGDHRQAMYLLALRAYKKQVGRQTRALFVVLTKFDNIRFLLKGQPEVGAPLSKWQPCLIDLLKTRMPQTYNAIDLYRQEGARVWLVPVWIELERDQDGNPLKPPKSLRPLSYSSATIQEMVQKLGTF